VRLRVARALAEVETDPAAWELNRGAGPETSLHQHFPQSLSEIPHKQQIEQFSVGSNPRGNTCRHDLRVIHHHEIPWLQQRREIGPLPMQHTSLSLTIQHKQTCTVTRDHRVIGHKRWVKGKVEVAE